jgi:hypothetical protein
MADNQKQGTGVATFIILVIIGAVFLIAHYHAQATKANQQLLQSQQTQSQTDNSSTTTPTTTTPTYTAPATTAPQTPTGQTFTHCTPPANPGTGEPETCTSQGPSGVTSQNCYSDGFGGYNCN